MSQPDPAHDSPESPEEKSQGDPWHAFGYLVSGVFMYGFLGWLADRWLDTEFLVVIGILFGAFLGIFMTIKRFDALPKWPRAGEKTNDVEKK